MQKKEKKGIHYLKVYHFKENKLGKMIYPWYIQVKLDFLENFCQGFTKNLNFFNKNIFNNRRILDPLDRQETGG
jgi:hypothetical protein